MTRISTFRLVSGSLAALAFVVLVAVVGSMALAAQDKYTLQVPNGLAFSDFRGYENLKTVAVSETETGIKMIVANPTMMAAYRDGLPADGKHFPDSSTMAATLELMVSRVEAVVIVRSVSP